tara:strand:- start:96 stop:1148 length:1053 start_codon:yes stop_codon:yes gene_type:complete
MATILLRSPYYETHSQAYASPNVAKSAILTLSVNGTQISEMSKDTVLTGTTNQETGTISFEIADLCRDYLDITFNNSYTAQTIAITGTLVFKNKTVDEINTGASGVANVGSSVAITHTGLDGYYEFMEGTGTGQNSAKTIATNDLLIDTTLSTSRINPPTGNTVQLYYPVNTAGQIPYWNGTTIIYSSFSASATTATVISTVFVINRVCNKHTAYKVTFVNKYGALQDFYFDGKTTENIKVNTTKFKRNINNTSFEYDKQKHSIKQFNTLANEGLILNTPPMSFDSVNESMKQLLVSEQVWIRKVMGGSEQTVPIIITSNQQTIKTGLNDKVIQYTITAEYAFDYISNIR